MSAAHQGQEKLPAVACDGPRAHLSCLRERLATEQDPAERKALKRAIYLVTETVLRSAA